MSFNSKFNRRRTVLTWQLCTFIALMLMKTTFLTHLMHACRCSDCVPVHLETPPPHSHCSSGPPSSPTRTSTNDVILTGRLWHLARTCVSPYSQVKMVATVVEHVVADAGAFLKRASLQVSYCWWCWLLIWLI